MGGAQYVRDREGEFGDRDLPRKELLARLDATARAVEGVLGEMDDTRLHETFPGEFPMGRVRTGRFLLALLHTIPAITFAISGSVSCRHFFHFIYPFHE